MIAPCDAARHLQVEQAIADMIAAERLANDMDQRRAVHRPGDPQLTERTVETIEMPGQIDDQPMTNLANLIDAIGKLKAAIFDVNHGVAVSDVTTIHIGYSRHDGP
jgi:hypothetical protein